MTECGRVRSTLETLASAERGLRVTLRPGCLEWPVTPWPPTMFAASFGLNGRDPQPVAWKNWETWAGCPELPWIWPVTDSGLQWVGDRVKPGRLIRIETE